MNRIKKKGLCLICPDMGNSLIPKCMAYHTGKPKYHCELVWEISAVWNTNSKLNGTIDGGMIE